MKTLDPHLFLEIPFSINRVKYSLLIILVYFGFGCGPSYKLVAPTYLDSYDQQEYQRLNSLTYLQSKLAIPEEFHFETSEDQGTFFLFSDQMGNVAGQFMYVRTKASSSLDPEGVAKYWAESALSDYDNKELSKTYINGKESYIIRTKTKGKFDLFYAVIPEGTNLNLIRVAADENYLHTHLDVPYRIYASYRLEKKGLNERIRKNAISFRSEDNIWTWSGDLKAQNGYYLSAKLGNNQLVLKIQQVEGANIYDIVKKQEMKINDNVKANSDFTVQKFSTTIMIGGKNFDADCIANQNEDSRAYFYLLKASTKVYLISVSSDSRVFTDDNNNALNVPFVKDALNRYLFFNE